MTKPDLHEDMARTSSQLLHFVFGGELTSLNRIEFADVAALDMVGIYPNYAAAHKVWKAKAQSSVDNAHMRYFIVHMHRLLDPDAGSPSAKQSGQSSGQVTSGPHSGQVTSGRDKTK
jgi:Domain of unknown function (DUF4170)